MTKHRSADTKWLDHVQNNYKDNIKTDILDNLEEAKVE
jgi:hypothetical protein